MYYYFSIFIYRVYKKTEQICNRSQRCEAAKSMKFTINIDCQIAKFAMHGEDLLSALLDVSTENI